MPACLSMLGPRRVIGPTLHAANAARWNAPLVPEPLYRRSAIVQAGWAFRVPAWPSSNARREAVPVGLAVCRSGIRTQPLRGLADHHHGRWHLNQGQPGLAPDLGHGLTSVVLDSLRRSTTLGRRGRVRPSFGAAEAYPTLSHGQYQLAGRPPASPDSNARQFLAHRAGLRHLAELPPSCGGTYGRPHSAPSAPVTHDRRTLASTAGPQSRVPVRPAVHR